MIVVFKPDAIGDFILATGSLRVLVQRFGAKNLLLVVHTDVAPLARAEFPESVVLPLPIRHKRIVMNVMAVNLWRCAPLWLRLCARRYEAVVSFRHARNYLQAFFFFGPPAAKRIGCENPLLGRAGRVRRIFEGVASRLFGATQPPYPERSLEFPAEIEANRRVVSALLGEDVPWKMTLPHLRDPGVAPGTDWLLCPFSSSKTKDYPVAAWAAALRDCADLRPAGHRIVLAGGPDQAARLEAFRIELTGLGIDCVEVASPGSLGDFSKRVAAAAIVLTVDTAAAHFACALRRPAVILMSGFQPGVYGPYSPGGRQHWLLSDREATRIKVREWHRHFPDGIVARTIRQALAAV